MKRFLLIPLVLFLSYTIADNRNECEVSISYQSGWNLISLPVEVGDAHYQSLFPNSIEGTLYSFTDNVYSGETEMNSGQGYWLFFNTEGTEILTGECVNSLIISMNEGWNMISGGSYSVDISDIGDPGGIIIENAVFGFDGNYFTPTTLEPGIGYWLRTNNTGFMTIGSAPPEGAIEIFPGDDINYIVDNNPEGTAFIIKAGIHRMQEIYPKNGNTFWGETGAILNGSRILTEFETEGGLYYVANQTQGDWYGGSDICQEGWERCNHPEDLYFDDEPLRHVNTLADVAPGKWFFNYDNDRIYFADDPTGHTVETSVTYFAFTNSASSVTIQNLVIEKFASMVMMGAVGSTGGENWLVEGNEVRLNHGVGVFVRSESIVRNNYIHHNGQMGVGTGTEEGFWVTNVLFEANEISYNNYAHVDPGFEAGGSKFALTDGLEVIGNYVHHNIGPGLWTDIDNTNILYEGNWVWWNQNEGIVHEISHDVVIRNNDVRYNGIDHDVWLWGSQILIHVSDNAEVYNNTVYIHAGDYGGNGIGIMNYNRPSEEYGDFYGMNNYIHHNEITHLGLYGSHGIVDDGEVGTDYYYDGDGDGAPDWGCSSEANNLFDYNSYHHNGVPEKFEYCETWYLNWEQFQAAGQEPNGTMDSNVIPPDDTPPQVCPICPGN